jgi:hypothetical protein
MMTEKDATKCRLLNPGLIHQDFWYLEVDAELPPGFITSVINKAGVNMTLLPAITNDSVKV